MSQNQELNRLLVDKCLLYPKRPITWSAVLSGAILAFGLTFLFNLLTLGMGLAIVSNNPQSNATEIAIGGFIWALIGGTIILFITGWKTGRLIRLHPQDVYDFPVQPTPMGPSGTEGPYPKVRCGCYHGMTHGFLAWGVYLIISVFFTILIAHTVSLSGLRSSFLNIPMGIPQALVESSDEDQTRNVQQQSQQNRARMPAGQRGSATVSPQTAEKAGIEVIGIFLIFAFGALASSIGSHLGVIYHKKCVSSKHREI